MTRFLTGNAIVKTINQHFQSAEGPADVAVAYWGRGAASDLGLTPRHKSVRIICDLWSMFCNPSELATLIQNGYSLRSKDDLHAKVYLIGDRAIVGSANASSKGLATKGKTLNQELEAAVEVSDDTVIGEIRAWFGDTWDTSTPIDADTLKRMRPMWEATQRQLAGLFNGHNLFARLAASPNEFKQFRVKLGFFKSDTTYEKLAEAAWQQVKNRYSFAEQEYYEEEGYPIYLPTKLRLDKGDLIVNYWIKAEGNGRLKVESSGGSWRVFDIVPVAIDGTKRRVVLAREQSSFDGIKFSQRAYQSLRKHLQDYIQSTYAHRPFTDQLIDFGDIEVKEPKLFSSIRKWSNTSKRAPKK